jgi:succinate dehydrogenase / fumarate reductase flavoprotein subunit
VYLDFSDAVARLGKAKVKERYGNLFDMYQRITGDDPYSTPMRIYPAIHYTMGGLWVDYNLMSTIPGLFVGGEANFSDHGANRLGASALMQGLADGYFILPSTVANFIGKAAADGKLKKVDEGHPEVRKAEADVKARINKLLSIKGKRSPDSFHRELGLMVWDHCGMARSEEGLKTLLKRIPELRAEFWQNLSVLGSGETLNQSLEKAGRVADFLEMGELMALDALERRESCGGHFRVESQTEDGEAKRDDQNYQYAAAWEFQADGDGPGRPVLHKEPLEFEYVKPSQRSYK